jgi:hypothetical protein
MTILRFFFNVWNRYFTRITEQMRERLAWYKSTIEVCSHTYCFAFNMIVYFSSAPAAN